MIKNAFKIGAQFVMHLGGQHGSQNPPKILPKSIKNQKTIDINMKQNFACILHGLLVAFGANMAQKASQKGSVRGGKYLLLLSLEGTWGALGGFWGPRADFSRFLIDFGRIFGPCWPQKPPKGKHITEGFSSTRPLKSHRVAMKIIIEMEKNM